MEKWKPLNMEVRSWAISHVLRLEQTSISALKAILRMFKTDSKTLGNQSSALQFKSRIDLLFDLEEIDKTEYNHLIKLMEIRNQFAHNPNAISFSEFDKINPEINRYLLKHCPADLENENDIEIKLKSVFVELFKNTAAKLLSIEIEYTNGIEREMRRFINDKIVENVDKIWTNAIERKIERNSNIPRLYLLESNENEVEDFYNDFRIAMTEFSLQELNKLEGKENTIFKQKEAIKERIERVILDKGKTKLGDST
jgi:hypothetical protein